MTVSVSDCPRFLDGPRMRRCVSFHALLGSEMEFQHHLPVVLRIHTLPSRTCIGRAEGRCCRNFVSDQSRAWKLTSSTHPRVGLGPILTYYNIWTRTFEFDKLCKIFQAYRLKSTQKSYSWWFHRWRWWVHNCCPSSHSLWVLRLCVGIYFFERVPMFRECTHRYLWVYIWWPIWFYWNTLACQNTYIIEFPGFWH
jgi:hypothetical protein